MVGENELPLRSLLEAAPDGFVVADRAGVIVWANKAAHEIFGYAEIEMVGGQIEQLVPERLRDFHVPHRTSYVDSPRARPMGLGLSLTGRKKDGSEFPVEISLSPLQTSSGLLITAVVRDVSERRQLEGERNLLAIQLETEQERDRIAMDLHDGIMQDIYAAALTLEIALGESDDKRYAAAQGVERAIDQLHNIVRNIRSYIFELRPREFSGSLPQALANLAQEFGQNSQIDTQARIAAEIEIETQTAIALYHIAHEALSNIQKHAQAAHVTMALRINDGMGELEVHDDGAGFDTSVEVDESHRGLRNMAARSRAIGAEVRVESARGSGTTLLVRFPVK